MSAEELYQEVILDHFRHPRHRGPMAEPSSHARIFNPLCGDEILVEIKREGDRLADISFQGQGCSISQASASMMASICRGKTIEEIKSLYEQFRAMLYESKPAGQALGDAASLAGVAKFPARMRCALLSWEAIELALKTSH